jgi:Tfp pilus assembly protein PilE
MQQFKAKSVIIALIVVAIISFIAWMEYKAYQFRSVMRDAFSWIWEAINTNVKPKEDTKTAPVEVPKGNSYTFENWIKISIDSSKDIWSKYQKSYSSYQAVNNFYMITLAWENSGKEPSFQSLSRVQLQLSDWTKFNAKESVQLWEEKAGFGWCIQCSMNPWEKSIEGLLFDLPKWTSLDW